MSSLALLAPVLPYLIGGAVLAGLLALVLAKARAAGRSDERMRSLEKALEVRDAQIRVVRPDAAGLDGRLRRGDF